MDKNIVSTNIGFEIYKENDQEIILKRVLTINKPIKSKEKFNREMSLPKLTVQCFNEDDIELLQTIEEKLMQELISVKKRSFHDRILRFIFKK